jgi:hypothetical protein
MTIHFHALPTDDVRALQRGSLDANGLPAERALSDGGGNPCRHCLEDIPEGKEMLILALRPFSELQPYAECGPVFLCADECDAPKDSTHQPDYFSVRESVLLKGYTGQQRIKYGTGQIVPPEQIKTACEKILANPDVAFVDIRSATNNCFQCRVDQT